MSYYYISFEQKQGHYLSHHGILGQKWGIRRFQNKDGSLTNAGRRRYQNGDGASIEAGKRNLDNYDPYDKKHVKKWTRTDDIYRTIIREPEYYEWAENKRNALKEERAKKSDKENEADLKSIYNSNEKKDWDEAGHDEQLALRFQKELREYSRGDHGEIGVSPEARKWENTYNKFVDDNWNKRYSPSYFAEREKLRLQGCGVFLKDLGYKDTDLNRRYIYGTVFDSANIPIKKSKR